MNEFFIEIDDGDDVTVVTTTEITAMHKAYDVITGIIHDLGYEGKITNQVEIQNPVGNPVRPFEDVVALTYTFQSNNRKSAVECIVDVGGGELDLAIWSPDIN